MIRTKQKFFSIIIPVLELGYFLIWECLPALDKQTFKNFEVIVLHNNHSQYDTTLLKKYRWLRIIPTGIITNPAQKRDLGAKHAKGTILAFLDDDSFPKENWLESASIIFNQMQIASIGGPGIIPKNATLREQAFDQILRSRAGSGSFSYRFEAKEPRFVDDFPSMNFFIQKITFNTLGGFDSDYWPGEDSKLCEKIVKSKEHILYSPATVVFHHRRKTIQDFLYQHRQYGFHRGSFFRHGDINSRHLIYLIPTFFVIYIVTFVLFSFITLVFKLNSLFLLGASLPLLFYWIVLNYIFFLTLIRTKNLLIACITGVTYVSTHIVYGIQFIQGFFKPAEKKISNKN